MLGRGLAVAAVLVGSAAVAVLTPEDTTERPEPPWLEEACLIIDGEDDPC